MVTVTVSAPNLHFDHTFRPYAPQTLVPIRDRKGEMRVTFHRVKGVADTIASADVTLQIKDGNVSSVGFTRMTANLDPGCFGCTGKKQFPMRGSAANSGDVIWLYWYNAPPLCEGCVTQSNDANTDARRITVAALKQ